LQFYSKLGFLGEKASTKLHEHTDLLQFIISINNIRIQSSGFEMHPDILF